MIHMWYVDIYAIILKWFGLLRFYVKLEIQPELVFQIILKSGN